MKHMYRQVLVAAFKYHNQRISFGLPSARISVVHPICTPGIFEPVSRSLRVLQDQGSEKPVDELELPSACENCQNRSTCLDCTSQKDTKKWST